MHRRKSSHASPGAPGASATWATNPAGQGGSLPAAPTDSTLPSPHARGQRHSPPKAWGNRSTRRQGQPTGAVPARPAGPGNRDGGNTPLPRAKGYLRPGKLAFTARPRRPRSDACGPAGAPLHCMRPCGPHSNRCPYWAPGPVWGMPHRHSSLPSRPPPAPPPVALPRERQANALPASSAWVFQDTPHGHPRPPRTELASP